MVWLHQALRWWYSHGMQDRPTFYLHQIQTKHQTAKVVPTDKGQKEWKISQSLPLEGFAKNIEFKAKLIQIRKIRGRNRGK